MPFLINLEQFPQQQHLVRESVVNMIPNQHFQPPVPEVSPLSVNQQHSQSPIRQERQSGIPNEQPIRSQPFSIQNESHSEHIGYPTSSMRESEVNIPENSNISNSRNRNLPSYGIPPNTTHPSNRVNQNSDENVAYIDEQNPSTLILEFN